MTEQIILLVVAAGFSVVTGANDGASILSPGIPLRALHTGTALLIMVAALIAAPFVSTRVATTFTQGLVSFSGADPVLLMVIAVLAAMIVVGILAMLGLPTSLGLAILGSIVGVGLGAGEAVQWPTVITVLIVGALAPVAGGLLAYAIILLFRIVPATSRLAGQIKVVHQLVFVVLSLAYAFNGGQKMLAIFAIAYGSGVTGAVTPQLLPLIGLGLCFALGVVIGLPAVSSKLSFGLYSVRPPHTIAAEISASAAALVSTTIGAPVSMTQAITGGLVGAGLGTGSGRVRWRAVSRMALAWTFTLPSTAALAAGATLAIRMAGI